MPIYLSYVCMNKLWQNIAGKKLLMRFIKTTNMDHKEKLTKLHAKSLKKVDEYIKTKGKLKRTEHAKMNAAKKEWNAAWNKMMEMLLVLEKLEI